MIYAGGGEYNTLVTTIPAWVDAVAAGADSN